MLKALRSSIFHMNLKWKKNFFDSSECLRNIVISFFFYMKNAPGDNKKSFFRTYQPFFVSPAKTLHSIFKELLNQETIPLVFE